MLFKINRQRREAYQTNTEFLYYLDKQSGFVYLKSVSKIKILCFSLR